MPLTYLTGFSFLTTADISFIQNTLSDQPGDAEGILYLIADPECADAIIDNPKLVVALEDPENQVSVSLQFYFYIFLRALFLENKITDTDPPKYISRVLSDHLTDKKFSASYCSIDQEIEYGIDLLALLQKANRFQQYELHAYAANHFLFLTGCLAPFIRRRKEHKGAPGVRYYEQIGIHSFKSASFHPLAKEMELEKTYQNMAKNFRKNRQILNYFSDQFLQW